VTTLKKICFASVLVLFFMLAFCFGKITAKSINKMIENEANEEVESGKIVIDSKGDRWYVLEIKGHKYLRHSGGIHAFYLHDPDCQCQR
jgi:hypothetical protein